MGFDFFSILTLFGGLAIFLYGMNVMGDGLEKFSGGKLKSILENLTSNPIKGVLLGAGVTAIIQSSSATTVMVVGFVNSGIMKLSQAIGIIMGANVGTTITSWLLSLTGIEGDNFFLELIKPSSFAPVLACVGIVMTMFLKGERKNNLGSIFIGFGVLMTGMELMSGAVKPLADVPEFQNILLMFSNPILGILTGALLTAVIQSSSASVGILQALSVTGSIKYSNAIPIIIGQNIGTCITAILSSIGTNKDARRTSVVHLSFNILGTLSFLILYYSLNAILKFDFIEQSINAADIAIIHTLFNFFTTAVLLPFTKQLERLAYFVIKDDENTHNKYQLLDERLLNTPSVAAHQAKSITNNMAMYCVDSFDRLLALFNNYNDKDFDTISDNEEAVDRYEDKLGTYLVRLSSHNLTAEESHAVARMLHTLSDFERMTDHALNISGLALEIRDKNIIFSDDAANELKVITDALLEIVDITTVSFVNDDLELSTKVEPIEQVIDKLKDELKARHVERLQRGECTVQLGFVFSDILTNYERVSDHCSNIAVYTLQIDSPKLDAHKYLRKVKANAVGNFIDEYNEYEKKYSID